MEEKKCLDCGKLFSTKWSFQKYCCEQHEKRHWAKRVKYNERVEVIERLKQWRKSNYPRICKVCKTELPERKRKCPICFKPPEKKHCKLCGNELETRNISYCNNCKNHSSLFVEHKKQQKRDSFKKWYKNPKNKKRMFLHLKKYRNGKNKLKYYSRIKTYKIYRTEEVFPKIKSCKTCGSKVYVQIHHEVYPTKVKEIRQAIKEGKIYFLCRKCHGKKRRKDSEP